MEIYLHIPFCGSKCRYCDFASWPGQEALMPAYVEAVCTEAQAMAEAWPDTQAETVFIGGGTPSILPPELLDRLLEGVLHRFPLAPGAEFTSEANPGTLTAAWLETAVRRGVNRLSMGMQAFQPELLRMLGRRHSFADVQASVRLARDAGIRSLNLDLMFGLPGQTEADWSETLEAALSLEPEHLSCYGLIPEEGTPLMADLEAGRLSLPDEDTERAMYDTAIRRLRAAGFAQYEISNFARPGFACRHNIGYWKRVPYIGLGLGAASLLPPRAEDAGSVRTANPATLPDYLAMVERRDWSMRASETVSPADARFESMMLGLRMTEGVSEAAFQAMHGVSLGSVYGPRLRSLAERGLVEHTDGCWRLTRRGMDIQNSILVELMEA